MPNYWYDHVHLFSPDPLKTAQFYESMFNAKRVAVRELSDGRTIVILHLNGSRVLITEREAQTGSVPGSLEAGCGLEHFGIRTDNLEVAVAELKAKGVQFKEEIRDGLAGVKAAFLWAPENVLIELKTESPQ